MKIEVRMEILGYVVGLIGLVASARLYPSVPDAFFWGVSGVILGFSWVRSELSQRTLKEARNGAGVWCTTSLIAALIAGGSALMNPDDMVVMFFTYCSILSLGFGLVRLVALYSDPFTHRDPYTTYVE